jgi:hypothetical protein
VELSEHYGGITKEEARVETFCTIVLASSLFLTIVLCENTVEVFPRKKGGESHKKLPFHAPHFVPQLTFPLVFHLILSPLISSND